MRYEAGKITNYIKEQREAKRAERNLEIAGDAIIIALIVALVIDIIK